MKICSDCQKKPVTRGKAILAGVDHDHRLMDHLPQLYPRHKR